MMAVGLLSVTVKRSVKLALRGFDSLFCFWGPQQAADIKVLGSLGRDDLKKLCGDNFPEWISFPQFEQVSGTSTEMPLL